MTMRLTSRHRTPPHTPSRQRGFLNPNIAKFLAFTVLGFAIIGALIIAYALIFINPRLPSLDVITDYRPKIPLRIYSEDHVLLGEFGEENAIWSNSTTFRRT
jgi:penicillin-binding protein 1A